MHFLPGVLTLLLAAPAAGSGVTPFTGTWQGTVATTPGGCAWKVTATVREQGASPSGSFSYSGPCADVLSSGMFSSVPSGEGCFAVEAGVPGMPKLNFFACYDVDGNLALRSMLLRGTLKLSEEATKATLDASFALATASGTLKKISGSKAGKKGKKGNKGKKVKKDAEHIKPPTLEIYGGGY